MPAQNTEVLKWEDNPKWLFDDFRSRAFSITEDKHYSLKIFLDSLLDDRLIDPEKIQYSPWLREHEHLSDIIVSPNKAVQVFHPLIEALTNEAVETMKVFGSDYAYGQVAPFIQQRLDEMDCIKVNGKPIQSYWGEYDDYKRYSLRDSSRAMSKAIAVTVFRTIREHAFYELLHREGQISDSDYQTVNVGITARLDSLGINGLEKLLKAHPDLEDRLKTDEGTIEIEDFFKDPHGTKCQKVKRCEYYTQEFAKIEASIDSSDEKQEKIVALRKKTMGKNYIVAANNKNSAIEKLSWQKEELLRDNRELFEEMRKPFYEDIPLRAYMINNYIGSRDPRLAEYFKSAGISPDDIFQRAVRVATQGAKYKKDGGYEPIFPQGADIFTTKRKQEQNDSRKIGEKESHSEETTSRNTLANKKHKNFVTAGKITTTAILGMGVIDGARNMMKKNEESDPDKPNQNSKIFWRAVEIAAAIAGIILVWKCKTVHNFFNNLFKAGGQSV